MGTITLDDLTYKRLFDCVHCGLCLAQCPTYAELGVEMDSPRGRIYLMRALHDGRAPAGETVTKHLDLCLDCRACETACPSGVQYGHLIESTRTKLYELAVRDGKPKKWHERLLDYLMYEMFPYRSRMAPAVTLGRWMQRLKLDRLMLHPEIVGRLPERLQKMASMMPKMPAEQAPIPHGLPPVGPKRATVVFFVGCVSESFFSPTNRATLRVLQRNGCEILIPDEQGCCGAIHHHGGRGEEARRMARQNIAALMGHEADAIVTNVAGCGAMLKEYGDLLHDDPDWADRARDFSRRVKDANEFLDALGLVPPTQPLNVRAVYHDACHLAHGQKVRVQPRSLLAKVPGLELVPLAESDWCCGAAGTYNMTQPEMALRLIERKLRNVDATGAKMVIASNAGCLLQMISHAQRTGRDLEFAHPMDVLDRAYGDA